jgi:hypothetical protein
MGESLQNRTTFGSPIIICGPARGATSAVRELLSAHRDIVITNEFPLQRLPSLVPFLEELGTLVESGSYRGDWAIKKAETLRSLWFVASGEGARGRRQSRRFGNKTPWAEFHFEWLDSIFEREPPQYVFALREGDKVFLSHRNTDWASGQHLDKLLQRYKESLDRLEAVREHNPSRLFLVQLDRVGDQEADRWRLIEPLFEFLGEKPDDGVSKFVREWPRVNPISRDPGWKPRFERLPPEDERRLAADTEYQELMHRYGYR